LSSPMKTKQGKSVLHDKADRPIAPLKLNSSTYQGDEQKQVMWPHRSWNLLKQQAKTSATQKTRRMKSSEYFNGNDAMIPTTEEDWNIEYDDEIALLATPIPSYIEPLFSPSDEEDMFPVISPLSMNSFVSSSSPSCSTQRSFQSPTLSTEKSPTIWKRVSMLKPRKRLFQGNPILSSDKKKNPKEEIEIQFECFFEEEDEHPELYFPTTAPRDPAAATLFRRTSLTPSSWWTQALGTVQRGCRRRASSPRRPARSPERSAETADRGPASPDAHRDEEAIPPPPREAPLLQFHVPFHAAVSWEDNVPQIHYFDALDTSSVGVVFV
jgi:hypothetical protein